jgi:hypothetical protein
VLRVTTAALATSLALTGVAAADVPIQVPADLLGGRVAPGNPLPVDPMARPGFDDTEVDVNEADFWDLVWPSEAAPVAMSDSVECDEDLEPGTCGVWNDAAAALVPAGAATRSRDVSPPEDNVAPTRRLRPALGAWMSSQTPTLRWQAEPGASHYHVQIYLGPRRIASVWTAKTRVTLPPRLIDQGRYYMWSVWPATGPRRSPVFGPQIGRSVFGVVLRPRIVVRAAPGSGGRSVVGEIRPRIPGGVLALRGRGVPARVRIDADSRIRLAVPRWQAERITVRLVDPGTNPPKGIRR